MFMRSWVRIPAQYTTWIFFHINLLENLYCLFEKDINYLNDKKAIYKTLFNHCNFKRGLPTHLCV